MLDSRLILNCQVDPVGLCIALCCRPRNYFTRALFLVRPFDNYDFKYSILAMTMFIGRKSDLWHLVHIASKLICVRLVKVPPADTKIMLGLNSQIRNTSYGRACYPLAGTHHTGSTLEFWFTIRISIQGGEYGLQCVLVSTLSQVIYIEKYGVSRLHKICFFSTTFTHNLKHRPKRHWKDKPINTS